MRRIVWLGMVLVIAVSAVWLLHSAAAQTKPAEFGYLGSSPCKACHSNPAKGEQYKKWEASPHAQAYQVLLTDRAKEVAKTAGLSEPPEACAKCLKCHVTGYGAKPELFDAKFDKTQGIGCETCHGPASQYKLAHMKDPAGARKLGMTDPGEKLCVTCHNESSPTYKPFKFAEFAAKIAHPNPLKKTATKP